MNEWLTVILKNLIDGASKKNNVDRKSKKVNGHDDDECVVHGGQNDFFM